MSMKAPGLTFPGSPGSTGASAYDLAVSQGFVGTLPQWLNSLVGPQGIQGVQGIQGNTGAAGSSVIGTPNTRTLTTSTAYQATNPANPSIVTINMNSTAALSLSAGTTNTASILIGPTSAVASGTGTVVGVYSNSLTGTLVVGLGVNTAATGPNTFALPAGYYFAVRVTAGAVTITSAFDQQVGP